MLDRVTHGLAAEAGASAEKRFFRGKEDPSQKELNQSCHEGGKA